MKIQTYIGVKRIQATPMMENDAYAKNLVREVPEGNREGYKIIYRDGYESWSPKDVFEEAYKITEGMTFGLAIEAMKNGDKVARQGWNGKGMWLRYVASDFYEMLQPKFKEEVKVGPEWNLLPWIGMKTADDKFVPWLASQTDILAEDWVIVKE